jgi:hypothetical protein
VEDVCEVEDPLRRGGGWGLGICGTAFQ